MKKLWIQGLVVAVVMSVTSVSAVMWQSDGVDYLWSNADNWTDDSYSGADVGVPTASTVVTILNPPGFDSPASVANAGAVADQINLGMWGHPGRLTVETNGTLTTTQHILLGNEVGTTNTVVNNGQINIGNALHMREVCTFENNGTLITPDVVLGGTENAVSKFTNTGDITISNWIYLSNIASNTPSVLNMNGGTLTAKHMEMDNQGRGHINLHGGTIDLEEFGLNGNGGYTIDVGAGVLIATGDHSGGLNWMASVGLITAYDGFSGATVTSVYNNVTGRTTLSASGGPVANYAEWAAQYGNIGSKTDDVEPDGLNNFEEYAFGGNPTNSDAALVSPSFEIGTDVVHVYNRRTSAAGTELTYELTVDADANLTTADWTLASLAGAVETNGVAADPNFESVTNTFVGAGAINQAFLKLEVSEN